MRPIPRRLVLILLTLGAVLAGVVGIQAFHNRFLANLERRLDDLSPEQLASVCCQLANRDEEGLGILVRALSSSREAVAKVAAETLRAKVREWRSGRADRVSQQVDLLADALARQKGTIHPSVRADVRWLAEQLLNWPVDETGLEVTRLIANCETILRDVPVAMRVPLRDQGGPRSSGAGPQVIAEEERTESLPLVNAPALEPLLLPPEPRTATRRDVEETQPIALEPNEQPIASRSRPIPPAEVQSPVARDDRPVAMNDWSIPELLAELRATESGLTRQAIVRELERRNWNATLIAIAERFADEDWGVRKKLVEDLPRLSVDSRPWLMLLARDPDPRVRGAAVGILSTGSDPEIQRWLREQEGEERDPEVLRIRSTRRNADRRG